MHWGFFTCVEVKETTPPQTMWYGSTLLWSPDTTDRWVIAFGGRSCSNKGVNYKLLTNPLPKDVAKSR